MCRRSRCPRLIGDLAEPRKSARYVTRNRAPHGNAAAAAAVRSHPEMHRDRTQIAVAHGEVKSVGAGVTSGMQLRHSKVPYYARKVCECFRSEPDCKLATSASSARICASSCFFTFSSDQLSRSICNQVILSFKSATVCVEVIFDVSTLSFVSFSSFAEKKRNSLFKHDPQ